MNVGVVFSQDTVLTYLYTVCTIHSDRDGFCGFLPCVCVSICIIDGEGKDYNTHIHRRTMIRDFLV